MGDNDAHMAQLFFAGHLVAVENASQDACGNVNGVVERIVVSVDILGGCKPLVAVHGLVDTLCDCQAGILGDRDSRIYKGTAFIGTLEIKDPLFCTCLIIKSICS